LGLDSDSLQITASSSSNISWEREAAAAVVKHLGSAWAVRLGVALSWGIKISEKGYENSCDSRISSSSCEPEGDIVSMFVETKGETN
jgi:hypothetical protein